MEFSKAEILELVSKKNNEKVNDKMSNNESLFVRVAIALLIPSVIFLFTNQINGIANKAAYEVEKKALNDKIEKLEYQQSEMKAAQILFQDKPRHTPDDDKIANIPLINRINENTKESDKLNEKIDKAETNMEILARQTLDNKYRIESLEKNRK